MKNVKFVIAGTYRTGSSALAESVGLHPQIACGWEWTLYIPPHRKLSTARKALDRDFSGLSEKHQKQIGPNRDKRVIGYKRLFRSSDKWLFHPRYCPALFVDRLEGHIDWWRRDPSIHIVHIIRRNNLDWFKSKVLADASGQYTGGAYPEDLRLNIDIGEMRRRLKTKAWIDTRLASLANTNRYLQVDYEDFLADNLDITSLVVEFLGCDAKELTPKNILRHQPQARARDAALITNLKEVEVAIQAFG